MLSVVIAAHNEESTIGECLDALLAQPGTAPDHIVVSANGCNDRTAEIAATRGVLVVDRAQPGKADALNAADVVATGFPRIYLDADIIVPENGLRSILTAFEMHPEALAVVPGRRVDTTGRPWTVRSYFAIYERLPVFRKSIFGRGLIALSETGRSRFTTFPSLISDDLFVDSHFEDSEKVVAEDVVVLIDTPSTTRDLVNRLVRVRRGNAQMRQAAARGEVEVPVRESDRWSWLRDVVARDPRLVFAAIPYVAITLVASRRAMREPGSLAWGNDRTSRGANRQQ